jgi:hypothetical protein
MVAAFGQHNESALVHLLQLLLADIDVIANHTPQLLQIMLSTSKCERHLNITSTTIRKNPWILVFRLPCTIGGYEPHIFAASLLVTCCCNSQ